jgi:hypothetical protein
MRRIYWFLILLIACAWLTGCRYSITTPYPTFPLVDVNAYDLAPTLPEPSLVPTSSLPTPTEDPCPLTATVWSEIPQVPILIYHRFDPRPGSVSINFMTSLSDFDAHLYALYSAGFSLVSLEGWLRGEIHVPEGRRPLILTIDDSYYADQLSLDENSQPASYSGIGLLWQFSQEHPDFGFQVALFYNFGDKAYANAYTNGQFSVQDGWRQDRAEAIAWGITHGAIPMNHFYDHPFLKTLSPDEIEWQLSENDRALREALALLGQENLAALLPNILAIPYVVWPDTEAGKQILYDYTSPEGAPVTAIVEGDYAANAKLLKAPFSPDFDPWHIPRINATWEAIDVIVGMMDAIPAAANCALGEFTVNPHINPTQASNAILDLTNSGNCPEGYFMVGQLAFQVKDGSILQLSP